MNGGALYLLGLAKVSIKNATFLDNTAILGGVVHIFYSKFLTSKYDAPSISITIANTYFDSNSAMQNGGCIYLF